MSSHISTDNILLQVNEVSKQYGESKVVNRISFDIKKNEILTLLGPSGCGKTTTLRMVSGLENSSGGEIIYRDKVVDSPSRGIFVPPNKRNLGMVFQSYAIWPQMTIYENVAYPLHVRKMNKADIKKEVTRALDLVGLAKYADRSSGSLSGGQQQRVAFARSIVYHPDLLLLDEPFSNLDARLREQMRKEVKQIQERLELSVLFVTHDQSEALSLSDRIVVLSEGEIEQIGAPMDLYDKPSTAFVRDFLGNTVLFKGEVTEVTENGIVGQMLGNTEQKLHSLHPLSAKLAKGEKFNLSVRPEQIKIVPNKEDNPNDNVILGTIVSIFFTGSQFEVEIDCSGEEAIVLNIPRTYDWYKGQFVYLSFSKEGSRLWPIQD